MSEKLSLNEMEFESFKDIAHLINKGVGFYFGDGKSKKAKEKLCAAMDGQLTLKNFSKCESKVDLIQFDWVTGHKDRNWWWQVQKLLFLDWCIKCWNLLDNDEKNSAYWFCDKALDRWLNCASNNTESPLVWHDHAACLRLDHISSWICFVVLNGLNGSGRGNELLTLNVFRQHIDFLTERKNYSKNTNHGFDQMLVLYKVSLTYSKKSYFKHAFNWALKRLVGELDFVFTSEGVHKENSPAYQKLMFSRLERLGELKLLGDEVLCLKAKPILDGAKKFLADMTLPTGFLPLIGDTQENDSGVLSDYNDCIEVLDYTCSGYCIIRGLDDKKEPFHLIYKASHLSHYHRHDDDLSFHLYYNGETIFGDAGLFAHSKDDPNRVFVRSVYAHTTVFPLNSEPIRRPKHLSEPPKMYLQSDNVLIAESSFCGERIKRSLDFSKIKDGEITIRDCYTSSKAEGSPLCMNFFMPPVERYSKSNQTFTMYSEKNRVDIKLNEKCFESGVYTGLDDNGDIDAIISKTYGKSESAARLTCCYKGWTNEVVHKIKLSPLD